MKRRRGVVLALAILGPVACTPTLFGQRVVASEVAQPVLAGTPPPSPEPEEPVVFSVYNVDIQAGKQPVWDEHVAHITRVKVGERVQLAVYVRAVQVPATFYLEYLWGVRLNGKLIAHHGVHTTISRSPSQHYWQYWTHIFVQPGTYRLTGTADINGTRRHRSLVFSVYR